MLRSKSTKVQKCKSTKASPRSLFYSFVEPTRGKDKKDSASMKGAERKAFMKDCMAKNAPPKKAASAQNTKMKTCSADFKASGKPSAERRAYMSSCMKK